MKKKFCLKNNRGQGLIEYIIIVAMIAVGAISLIRVLHQSVNSQFAQIAKALGARNSATIAAPEITSSMMQKKDLTNFMRGARSPGRGEEQNGASSEND